MLTGYLSRLGAGAAARQTFLEMRTKVMRGLVRRIRFEGHVGAYIGDLAVVWFTGLKHSADWFLSGFKENEVASCMFYLTLLDDALLIVLLHSFHRLGEDDD